MKLLRNLTSLVAAAALLVSSSPLPVQAAMNLWLLPPTADFPVMTPGTQYGSNWAATATPAAQGNSAAQGYSEPAIAGWDTPQYMEVQSNTPRQKLCVDAFHVGGAASTAIQKVSFSVNNGPWVDVTSPLLTPEANQLEYCAYLDVSRFTADQPTETRAIAYPVNGTPLVLQGSTQQSVVTNQSSMFGYAAPVGGPGKTYYLAKTNAAATNPCTQAQPCTALADVMSTSGGKMTAAQAEGAIICLNEPGTYDVTSTAGYTLQNRWLTITACGSATRATAFGKNTTTYASNNGGIGRLRYYNMSLLGQVARMGSGPPYMSYLLLDHVTAQIDPALGDPGTAAAGNANPSAFNGTTYGAYNPGWMVVDSTLTNYNAGIDGAVLARGNTITNSNDDTFSGTWQTVNNVVSNTGLRVISGPYTIVSIADTTHMKIAKTTALYVGDCLQGPADGSGAGLNANTCNVGSDPTKNAIISALDQTDPNYTTITLANPMSGTGGPPTKFMQFTQNHVDFWQWESDQKGLIAYGNTDIDRIQGQTIFWETNSVTNAAAVNNAFDNTQYLSASFPGNIGQQNSLNIGGTITNVLFSGNSHKGGVRQFNGMVKAVDFFEINDTCTNGKNGTIFPTMINSSGC